MSAPVLDSERLRAVSGGDASIELELVDMLLEEAEPLIAELCQLGEQPERSAAHELSHSLKGIAGNVGAIELRDAAAALDAALSDETHGSGGIDGFLQTIVAALWHIRAARAAWVDAASASASAQ
jgi:HPt (histidine-containing phosphotransfer) domain-containing protein